MNYTIGFQQKIKNIINKIMSKDPSFLFYTQDFLTGTYTMTNEQVGKYVRLLCLQHQTGHLSNEDMLNICKTYDKKVFSKFVKDENDNYYNERLENEINRRNKYCESRRKNRLLEKNICNSYVQHMENENIKKKEESEKKEEKQDKNIIPPSVKLVTLYCKERNNNISPREFIDFYESKGWLIGKNKMKDWQAAIRSWEKNDFNKEKTINNKKHPPIYDDHIKYIWDEEKQRYVHSVTKAVYIP